MNIVYMTRELRLQFPIFVFARQRCAYTTKILTGNEKYDAMQIIPHNGYSKDYFEVVRAKQIRKLVAKLTTEQKYNERVAGNHS